MRTKVSTSLACTRRKSARILAAATALCLLLGAAGTTMAAVHGIGASKSLYGPNGDDGSVNPLNPRAHVGDTVNVNLTVFNNDTFAAGQNSHWVTNLQDTVHHTSGDVTTPNLLSLNGGAFLLPTFGTFKDFFPLIGADFVVAANDPTALVDTALAESTNTSNGLHYTATPEATLTVVHPAITVTKNCALIFTNDMELVKVRYTGTVSNAGDVLLHVVTVVDDGGTPGDSSDDTTFTIGDLAVGASANFVGTNAVLSSFPLDTVVARGVDDTESFPFTVLTSPRSEVFATNNCSVSPVCHPSIRVTKQCPQSTTPVGGNVVSSGTVTNTGDVTLHNVRVFDVFLGTSNLVFGPVDLGPSQGQSFLVTNVANTCPTITNTLWAFGTFRTPACGTNDVSSHQTAICTIACPPSICITKEIVCMQANACELNWAKIATGVRDANSTLCPTFCYRITVQNCGDVDLTNVVVSDNRLNLSSCSFPTTLAQGASASCTVSGIEHCDSTTNVATVSGQSVFTAQTVTARDTNIALVLPAEIDCTKLAISPDDQDGIPDNSHVTLPNDGAAHEVVFVVRIKNTGLVGLTNITIVDPFCTTQTLSILLAPNEQTNVILCTNFFDCSVLPLTNIVLVSADVDRGTNGLCTFDVSANTNINVSCISEATVGCSQPAGCRTTGGGRQEKAKTFPTVRYVTHGGQVGAPISTATEFDPDSACIKGEFEHVRHLQGGLRGNFHARSFDSLLCACLACDGSAGTVVGQLCNPGNRPCGPEPRKAPANKIAFSGVGNYVLTSGRRTPRSVLFRIDIEDRSEPGGSHPKGQTPPPDRYRIRIWILTAQEKALLDNPADRLLAFRNAIAVKQANVGLLDGTSSTTTPTPLGTAVFGVRAPDIDDGGELDRGNRQIHPSIHTCP